MDPHVYQYDPLLGHLRTSHLAFRNPVAGEGEDAITHVYHARHGCYYPVAVWRTMPESKTDAVRPVVKRSLKEMYDDENVTKEYASKGNWRLYDRTMPWGQIPLGTHFVG